MKRNKYESAAAKYSTENANDKSSVFDLYNAFNAGISYNETSRMWPYFITGIFFGILLTGAVLLKFINK